VIETKMTQEFLDTNLSSINLTGDEEFTVFISMDDSLFNAIFDKYFRDILEENEKILLQNELSDEVINTVVGLSIDCFPKIYDDLVISIPLKVTKKDILKYKDYATTVIKTDKGSFICRVA
jgi:hypothetical protein